jgi:hypothetical protein
MVLEPALRLYSAEGTIWYLRIEGKTSLVSVIGCCCKGNYICIYVYALRIQPTIWFSIFNTALYTRLN